MLFMVKSEKRSTWLGEWRATRAIRNPSESTKPQRLVRPQSRNRHDTRTKSLQNTTKLDRGALARAYTATFMTNLPKAHPNSPFHFNCLISGIQMANSGAPTL